MSEKKLEELEAQFQKESELSPAGPHTGPSF